MNYSKKRLFVVHQDQQEQKCILGGLPMTKPSEHPTWNELVAFDRGLLLSSDWVSVAQHVAICHSCAMRLEAVPDDALISLLRFAWNNSSDWPTYRTAK